MACYFINFIIEKKYNISSLVGFFKISKYFAKKINLELIDLNENYNHHPVEHFISKICSNNINSFSSRFFNSLK